MTRQRFPIMRRALANWRERHQLPFNFWIHMVGIPVAVLGVPLLFVDVWWGLAAIVVGYILQWIGHRAEGNDVGEFIPFKKLLGLPYVAVAPRWQAVTAASDAPGSPSH